MRTMIALRWMLIALAAVDTASAQFAAEDFAATGCGAQADTVLFRSGVEPAEIGGQRPSGGSGGDSPGPVEFDVFIADTGRTHTLLAFLPSSYDALAAWPLLVVLHGAAGSAAAAPNAAAATRALWSSIAESEGIVVLAPIASGMQGGWVPGFDTPALACALEETQRRYNIDMARRTLWGFSAGGHYAHSLALANATRFAAYAVNAGALHALACAPNAQPGNCESTLPLAARRIPVGIRVGTGDTLRPYASGDASRFDAAGWTPGLDQAYSEFAGGHTVAVSDAAWAWGWLAPWRLPH